jgi:hypothetical protein
MPRAELAVARRVGVVVVRAEEERIDGGPLGPEREGLQHDLVSHTETVCLVPGAWPRRRVRAGQVVPGHAHGIAPQLGHPFA